MEVWLLVLAVLFIGFFFGMFIAMATTRRIEGFEEAIQNYKENPEYKKQVKTITSTIDPISGKRRDIENMLAAVAGDMPDYEQCFVNFHVLATRFTGYIGPNGNNFFDPDIAIPYALKAGCRAFIYEIDFLESCIGKGDTYDYYPKLVIRDIQGKLVSETSSTAPQCNSDGKSNIRKASQVLRDTAFSNMVQNPNDPLIIVLYLLRLPPVERTGNNRLLTYYSRIAKGLQPLIDKMPDSLGTGGRFDRQKQEGILLINNIRNYAGRSLIFCNADTSAFRETGVNYAPKDDLDYMVNLRLSYKQTQMGCTSAQTGSSYGGIESVDSFTVIPSSQVANTCNETKLRWTACIGQDPLAVVPQKTYESLTSQFGVHCVPIQFWNNEYTYIFDNSKFGIWSYIPKPKALRFVKPPIAVPARQVTQADAKGGALRDPVV
jgi:hypothetical protein